MKRNQRLLGIIYFAPILHIKRDGTKERVIHSLLGTEKSFSVIRRDHVIIWYKINKRTLLLESEKLSARDRNSGENDWWLVATRAIQSQSASTA